MKVALTRISTFLLLILALHCVHAIQITEIMYDPSGSDNNKEFIEVIGNIDNATIADSSSNDTLQLIQKTNSSYSLIVEEGFNHTNLNCSLYSAGAAIGNGLSAGEEITLIVGNATYTTMIETGGDGNGHSLERHDGAWMQSVNAGGSPCMPRPTFSVSVDNTSEPRCNVSFEVSTNKDLYRNDEGVAIMHVLHGTKDYQIEYSVVDLFGKEFKKKRNTSNSNTKSWTPPYKNELNVFVVQSTLHSQCGTHNSFKRIITQGPKDIVEEIEPIQESNIVISEVRSKNNQASFGETIYVDVEIYKGNTLKKVVDIYVTDNTTRISENVRTYMNTKYESATLTLPIPLYQNCKDTFSGGDYNVIVQGLGTRASAKITIEGKNNCDTRITTVLKNVTQPQLLPTIKSFYTRKRKLVPNDTIMFHTNVDDVSELVFFSGSVITINASNSTNTIATQLKSTDTHAGVIAYDSNGNAKFEITALNISKVDTKKTTPQPKKIPPAITGHAIAYESQNESKKKLGPYLFLGVSLIINIGFLIYPRGEKPK